MRSGATYQRQALGSPRTRSRPWPSPALPPECRPRHDAEQSGHGHREAALLLTGLEQECVLVLAARGHRALSTTIHGGIALATWPRRLACGPRRRLPRPSPRRREDHPQPRRTRRFRRTRARAVGTWRQRRQCQCRLRPTMGVSAGVGVAQFLQRSWSGTGGCPTPPLRSSPALSGLRIDTEGVEADEGARNRR